MMWLSIALCWIGGFLIGVQVGTVVTARRCLAAVAALAEGDIE